ncbi:hypothetical protein [Hyphococcus luteus]|uniref:hypothetical protein n=1 Tax=Hyphococcus luteus TaxID=2058213 RepID=UPI0010573B34|nr:hypothetical protein [Marinicaulis flavus]
MRHSLLISIFAISAAACSAEKPAASENIAPAQPELKQLWLAEGFSAPEGSAAAPGGGYFISNVAGEGPDKDGEGWISLISADGAMITERFADGFNAPKGMAVLDGVLYIADIDRVRMIDAASGEDKGDIAVEGAKFLNDATVWNGAVYVSDSLTNSILKIEDGAASVWITDDRLGKVNGVLGAGETLYAVTMDTGSLYVVDAQGRLTEIANGMMTADGVGLVEDDGWLVSTVVGEIFYVSPEGEPTKLIDTREAGISQNDLNVYGDIAIAPNWRPGTVTAWKINQ